MAHSRHAREDGRAGGRVRDEGARAGGAGGGREGGGCVGKTRAQGSSARDKFEVL